jgi:predicted DCC family thiol-disulfide oxidoreductase YuxK
MPGYLITDPDCGFCQRSGNWLEKHFGHGWSHTPAAPELLARLQVSAAEAAQSVWLIYTDNEVVTKRYAGSDAVARAISARGGIWRVALIATVPPLSWIAQRVYKLIAQNRHRLPGTASCETSTPH